jgi:hypothetical protein
MNVHLGKLAVGQWRDLTQQEMDEINGAVAGSSKTSSIKGEMNARHLKSAQRTHSEDSTDKADRHSKPNRQQAERTPRNSRENPRENAGKTPRTHAEKNRGRGKEPTANPRRGSSLTGKYNKK